MNPLLESEVPPNRETLGIILGGGAGLGLFPLTKDRAKPAVPLAGKYRLVDIPISNCINSGIREVFVLTQFNSASLNRHVSHCYSFDSFSGDFVDVLAAQQTQETAEWFQGTADAVRRNLRYFTEGEHEYFLIVSGDHLYRMDFSKLLEQHIATGAEITVATTPVAEKRVKTLGIVQTGENSRVYNFVEKPSDPITLAPLAMPPAAVQKLQSPPAGKCFEGNMGIYVFNRQVLVEALNNDHADFGMHIIPAAISKYRVHSYLFEGYWENIGTIGSFYEANLDLCEIVPRYDFFHSLAPIFTRTRFLPATKVNGGSIHQSLVSDGCILTEAIIENSIIGLRTVVDEGTVIRKSVLMGSNYYGNAINNSAGPASPGIGKNCRIERAIIDKNVRIGDNVVINPKGKAENLDDPAGVYYIRDGVVIIPKDTSIPDNTVI